MNYYKRHLGDYAKDTGHLSMLEDGAYNRLLDRYYSTERAIPEADIYRIARASSATEKKAVCAVLAEFFKYDEADKSYRHSYADRVIAKAAERAAHNRDIGKLGGRPKKTETVTEGNPNETQTVSENNPSHKPLATSHKEEEKAFVGSEAADPPKSDCPHEEIIAAYHELLPANPRVRVWDARRQTYLRSRWREETERQALDWWRKFFGYVAQSDFLTGKSANGTPFLPSLEWMLKPANFIKIIEGNYENR